MVDTTWAGLEEPVAEDHGKTVSVLEKRDMCRGWLITAKYSTTLLIQEYAL